MLAEKNRKHLGANISNASQASETTDECRERANSAGGLVVAVNPSRIFCFWISAGYFCLNCLFFCTFYSHFIVSNQSMAKKRNIFDFHI